MPKIKIDLTGEMIKAPLVPEGWYHVKVYQIPTIEVGKESGKKYMHWVLVILDGEQRGIPLELRTTLEKGTDPKRSKRWLFHQAMACCGIEKKDEKYEFDTAELVDKQFWVFVSVKEETYNNNPVTKNEVKKIALQPIVKEQVAAPDPEDFPLIGD